MGNLSGNVGYEQTDWFSFAQQVYGLNLIVLSHKLSRNLVLISYRLLISGKWVNLWIEQIGQVRLVHHANNI